MYQDSGYRITCEFEYKRTYYICYLCPWHELSEYEMHLYNISEYSYVVHLFSLKGFKTFEMFPHGDHNWATNASELLVNREIIEIISYVLLRVFR